MFVSHGQLGTHSKKLRSLFEIRRCRDLRAYVRVVLTLFLGRTRGMDLCTGTILGTILAAIAGTRDAADGRGSHFWTRASILRCLAYAINDQGSNKTILFSLRASG